MTDHVKQLINRKTSYVIPGYSHADDQTYDIHPVYQSLLIPKELRSNCSLNVPSHNRVANMEAMIVSFVWKWLPLALTGDIVTLSWELTRDTQTLLKVELKRTAAQYKLQLCVAKALEESILS